MAAAVKKIMQDNPGPEIRSTRKKRGRANLARLGLTLLALLGLAYLWCEAGRVLVSHDEPDGKQLLGVILMGEVVPRAEQARQLIAAGTLGHALFFTTERSESEAAGLIKNDALLTALYLDQHAVPPTHYTRVLDSTVSSTADEARATRAWIIQKSLQPREIVVVTSWYHSSRAGWIFRQTFAGTGIAIRLAPAYSRNSRPEGWWQREKSFLEVYSEYLKWLYYLIHY